MAPPPKDAKGPPKVSTAPVGQRMFEEFAGLVFVLLMVGMIYMRLSDYFGNSSSQGFLATLRDFFVQHILPLLHILAVISGALFAIATGWMLYKYTALSKEVTEFYAAAPPSGGTGSSAGKPEVNPKWARILSHLNSTNPNDWKFAILEADIMLSDLLDTLNYPGSTMADKLKVANPGDFKTLESAWEAHKIRNTVAHEGADYVLSDREARRVIDLYRVVFEEFKVI